MRASPTSRCAETSLPRRLHGVVLVLGLMALLVTGCSNTARNDTPSATTAAPVQPSVPVMASQNQTPVSPTASPSVPIATPRASTPPTPTALPDALAVIDLRTFPAMAGATRVENSPVGAHFSLPNGEIAKAIAFYRDTLTAKGWQPGTGTEEWFVNEHGAMLTFHKQGFMLYASIGISPADKNLNTGLFYIGNVDSRRLPRPPGAEVTHPFPARTHYTTALEPKAVKEFLRTELKKQGWVEYRRPAYAGAPNVPTMSEQEMLFVQRAVKLDCYIQTVQGKTQASAAVGLVREQLPILSDARVVEFAEDPLQLFYATSAETDKVQDFYRQELAALGWQPRAGTAPGEKTKGELVFTAAEKEPLRLEYLRDKEVTFVRLTRLPREKPRGRN